MWRLWLAASLVTLSASIAGAADFYVDAVSGDDALDGRSWSNARRTLAGAMGVPHLVSGDVVHVAPGVYDQGAMWDGANSNRVIVPPGVGLKSTAGAERTLICGAADPDDAYGIGDGAVRCARLGSGAWLQGFTITNGHTRALADDDGRGGGTRGGAAADCVFIRNDCNGRGLATFDTACIRCLFRDNRWYSRNGSLSVRRNKGDYTAYFSASVDCVFEGHDEWYGMGRLLNCTFGGVINVSSSQVGQPCYNCYVRNPGGNFAYTNCVFGCQAKDFPATATYDPATCRFEAGPADATLADAGSRRFYDSRFPPSLVRFRSMRDFDGNARVCGREIDIGAREADAQAEVRTAFGEKEHLGLVAFDEGVWSDAPGSLTLSDGLSATMRWTLSPRVLKDDEFSFTAFVGGTGVLKVYRNGATEPSLVLHASDVPQRVVYRSGTHVIRFRHCGTDGTSTVYALQQGVRFVDAVQGDDANDGFSPATAKRTLTAAMAMPDLASGDVIHALPGAYDEGEAWDVGCSNRVVVKEGVGLVADGGPDVTFIVGAADPTAKAGCGPASVRCVCLKNGSWVSGFAITGGRTGTTAGSVGLRGGAGVNSANGAAYGCIITNNTCFYRGSAAFGGDYFSCRFANNPSREGCGDVALYYVSRVVNSHVYGGDYVYSDGLVLNSTLVGGRTWAPGFVRVCNSHLYCDNGKASFTNCTFAVSKIDNASSIYDPDTCRFGVSPQLDAFGRPSAGSKLVDAGARRLYDALFPKEWLGFKNRDLNGGRRVCGEEIDIGAGEFQIAPEVLPSGRGLMVYVPGVRPTVKRPMAIAGSIGEIDILKCEVTEPLRMLVDDYAASEGGLAVDDYGKYSLVVIAGDTTGFSDAALWLDSDACDKVRAYLAAGGRILLTGSAVARFAALSQSAWDLVYGKGGVESVELGVYELKQIYVNGRQSLGYADDAGDYHLTEAGEHVAAHAAEFAEIFSGVESLAYSSEPIEWGVEPLGEPGTLSPPTMFARLPVLTNALPVRAEGVVLYDATNGTRAVITAPYAQLSLARELAWHLGEMTAQEFTVVRNGIPSSGPYVRIAEADGEKGCTILRRTDDGRGLLVGGKGGGISYALTYLLESLGCRYLWPGAVGKVIPRGRTRVVAPEFDVCFVPRLRYRGMRGTMADGTNCLDHAGNRGFYLWHGVTDTYEQTWARGHYFADYYRDYAAEHPDWFALQPNGSRKQNLGDMPERPTLCMSSAGLVAQTASNLVAKLRSTGWGTVSACLPDGGRTSQCMCRGCRALDPVNAPEVQVHFAAPYNRKLKYVSLSDRVFGFYSAIAAGVAAEEPNATVGCYAYSMYEIPPVAVTLHPALAVFCSAGSYCSDSEMAHLRRCLAGWAGSGARVVGWRPNLHSGMGAACPQGFARLVFEDIENAKENGYLATDFDCIYDQWSAEGLVYYMTARALRNFDRLDYETLFADYCEKGFGPAAPKMREYFETVEAVHLAAMARKSDNLYAFLDTLDADALEGLLDEAAALADGDAEVLARIAFVRKTLPYLRFEQQLSLAWQTRSFNAVRDLQGRFPAFLKTVDDDPLVFGHSGFQNVNHFRLHAYPSF